MSKTQQLSIIFIYVAIFCHSRTQDIFMKQHHCCTQLQVWTIDLKKWKNTVLKQYLCPLIPRLKKHERFYTWDFDLLIKKLIKKYYRMLTLINTTNINFQLLRVWLPFERTRNIFLSINYIYETMNQKTNN